VNDNHRPPPSYFHKNVVYYGSEVLSMKRLILVVAVLVMMVVFGAGCTPIADRPYSAGEAYQRAMSVIGSAEFSDSCALVAWAYNLPRADNVQTMLAYFDSVDLANLEQGDLVVSVQSTPSGSTLLVGLYDHAGSSNVMNFSTYRNKVEIVKTLIAPNPELVGLIQYPVFSAAAKVKQPE
jgi:hypothetical protein